MIKLIAKYASEDSIRKWGLERYNDVFGMFDFYRQKDCGEATNILFALLDESNYCSGVGDKINFAREGLDVIYKLGLPCSILVENSYHYELTEYLNDLGINATEYYPTEYCTVSFGECKK